MCLLSVESYFLCSFAECDRPLCWELEEAVRVSGIEEDVDCRFISILIAYMCSYTPFPDEVETSGKNAYNL